SATQPVPAPRGTPVLRGAAARSTASKARLARRCGGRGAHPPRSGHAREGQRTPLRTRLVLAVLGRPLRRLWRLRGGVGKQRAARAGRQQRARAARVDRPHGGLRGVLASGQSLVLLPALPEADAADPTVADTL